MIEISQKPISLEVVVNKVKTNASGCAVTYVGLIRGHSHGKPVLSVEYQDPLGAAESKLQEIASEIKLKWPVENVAICHRIGKLLVGDINLVVVVAATHRQEGFLACQYAINQFKQRLPTRKIETYQDGSMQVED